VPIVVDWLNALYRGFASGHGLKTAPMTVAAEAVYIDAPPVFGELMTAPQILAATGKNAAAFDFVIQIDLDKDASYAARNASYVGPGGGLAIHNCEIEKLGPVNIWSSVTSAASVRGGLVMDLNHEFSHMFGMMDDWPFAPSVPGPGDGTADDWIPYTMFGWTDTDGDGVAEILDSTPYGTAGPRP
jgi:hypothetical protein